MEPEVKAFLKRVAKSLMIGFLWLAINATAAIMGDNAFVGDSVTWANIAFYVWFVVSIIALIIIYKKMWQKKLE